MVLDKLGESLSGVVRKITMASHVDETLVKEVVKDIQRALLTSDVNVKLVMEISKKIEERALKEKPQGGLSKKEHVVHIVYEELVALVGVGEAYKLPTKARIMMIGLQGSGKTTSTVKLAKFFSKKGLRPFIIAADTFRAAAYDQMIQLAEPNNIKVYGEPDNKDAVEVVRNGLEKAIKADIIILDTAGRHKSEDDLFDEMKQMAQAFKPDEKFLVIDANIGQQAGAQAKAFYEAIGVTGVILSKLDGTAKGGGALSAVSETNSPINFVGTGEHIDNLEVFNPDRFISRLLGMGDLATLMEQAKDTLDEKKAMDILKGDFTFVDLREQIEGIRKMGSISNLMNMIPGMGANVPKEASQMTEEKMSKFIIIMDSMTAKERTEPKTINTSRVQRIALGSGTRTEDVKELMNYYKMMRKALKSFKKGFGKRGMGKGQMAKMMRAFK